MSIASEIDPLFSTWDKRGSPGLAIAIMKNGEIIYKRGYGTANLDHDVTIVPSSVFHAASVSKQFTAMAVCLLEAEGKLNLNDDVRDYVEKLPDFGTPINLRHLLHHTSGMRDYWDLLSLAGWRYSKDLITDHDILSILSRQKHLNFEPGSEHLYCNTGYMLLAQVVAQVAGESFRAFTSKRIFDPLGMSRSFFRDQHGEVIPDAAYGYHPRGDTFEAAPTNFETVGGTGLQTTVEDLALWEANFYTGRVGGKLVLKEMLRPGCLNDGTPIGYAGGLGLGTYRGLDIIEHSGGDAGYRCNLLRFPTERFSVAILGNLSSIDPAALARKVADICLESVLEEKVSSISSPPGLPLTNLGDIEALAGVYVDPQKGDKILHLHVDQGKLVGGAPIAAEAFALKPVASGRFRYVLFPNTEITFSSRGHLIQKTHDREQNRFVRAEPHPYSPTELEEFVGLYEAEENDYRYSVILHEGALALTALKMDAAPLTAISKDFFFVGRWRLRFLRDDSGMIAGLSLNIDRVRNFRLQKLSQNS
ncbi:serine hydrolase domain-containing protein [Phyllobacterium zundukense]|uniref:Beta-lactamase family protein n=1 Tax=Phyllobacterium zundukense TaxID=1867719 RepID=A0ACD4CYS1_9HYPH|nr:serine hydrolase domain-containing protein [Phyllobacterium zundukense]UXN58767.1 beta-lactamase family protein [Phyllobacterium zundukense]